MPGKALHQHLNDVCRPGDTATGHIGPSGHTFVPGAESRLPYGPTSEPVSGWAEENR
ncbi:hypothetical protein [Polymorphospora rubra]|uniref:Uncharacterized protein n=1 Tax=Polymorphospora rubra TaxID=338584 RepID=A0A810N0H7_9ACTN|nr:hypothetical protein [Polymorphospora rubra]BCJ66164.1 hypothetical protein Prubr_31850 [Polymorphospora rubra]